MKYLDKYSIDFKGLSNETHEFEYRIGERFFAEFEQSEITEGRVKANVSMVKTERNLTLDISIKGIVSVQCDRCLEYFDKRIKFDAVLIVNFGEKNSDLTDVDEIITLAHSESRLHLAQHFYEYINLSLPFRKIHKDKTMCNPEMLEKIKELSVTDDATDPRWEKLKSLYN